MEDQRVVDFIAKLYRGYEAAQELKKHGFNITPELIARIAVEMGIADGMRKALK